MKDREHENMKTGNRSASPSTNSRQKRANEVNQKWALIAVVVVVLAGTYFLFGQKKPFETERDSGRIEVTSGEEYKYFTYVSVNEARRLVTEARSSGEFVFLFPQIDFGDFEKLVIEEYETTTSRGTRVTILSIGGLPRDALVRSNIDGTIRASILDYEDSDMASLIIFTGEEDDFTLEFYMPYVSGENDLSGELEGVLNVAYGTPLISVASNSYLENEIFQRNSQMALIVQTNRGGEDVAASGSLLKNVLTKYGRIVMVE